MKYRKIPPRLRKKPAAFAFIKGVGSVVDFTGSSFKSKAGSIKLGTAADDAARLCQDFLVAEDKFLNGADGK